ncbi:MAG: DUF5606 domain-containing protein [Chitinophagaceae bacterium]|nr:DUF5606 domain-containing protein [Chitinophagaceae bacterium]
MEYSKIIAVTGLPGLYELVNSKNDGAIIRSLDDKSTRFASSRIHNFSHLESIEIYTTGENVNLVDIFTAMDKAGGTLPDAKENDAIKKYFEKVYPELDFERVYTSDLKKMVKWFDVLKKNGVEIKLSELPEEEQEETTEAEVKEEIVVVASAAKKPAPKKEAAPVAKAKKEEPAKEEPKKKAAPKAKKEEPAKAETKKAAPKKAAEKAEKPKAAAKPKKEAEDKTAKKKK